MKLALVHQDIIEDLRVFSLVHEEESVMFLFQILIKHGRALKTGEFRTNVFLLRVNEIQVSLLGTYHHQTVICICLVCA